MSDPPPIIEGRPLTAEELRLKALFDELEKGQMEFLDGAAKRIVELTTGLLGILLAIIAFGKDFPPVYLQDNPLNQGFAVGTLVGYMLAMLLGLIALWPRTYRRYHHNLTRNREELGKIMRWKLNWFRAAAAIFFLASLALASLIALLILTG